MNNTNNSKKAFILLLMYFMLLFGSKSAKKKEDTIIYNPEYQMDSTSLYASYNGKHIFIGEYQIIEEVKDDNPDNIYIIDERCSDNPSMSICDSYKVKSIHDIKRILEILDDYEIKYSSEWNRSIESMEREWIIHNICYFLYYETDRTSQVDLDNNDEKDYDSLMKILLNIKDIIEKEKEESLILKREYNNKY